MSSWSNLFINGYEVDSWKRSIGEGEDLFTLSDLVEAEKPYNYENYLDEIPKGYFYQNKASHIIDRLDLMGFSLKLAKSRFEEGVQERFGENANELQKAYTFEKWLELIKEVFDKKISRFSRDKELYIAENPLLDYVLNSSLEDFGYLGYGNMYMYRAMLELVPPDADVVLDISEMYDYSEEENYTVSPPQTIIITEGTSDKRILEETLKLLYPHLVSYFKFIDFDAVNLPGSAGHLLNGVRLLTATSTQNRAIAIFDNDSAGLDALRQLAIIPLPDNIKAVHLPYLPMATNYPTSGPQGNIEVDINGRACSIELYLGRDILKNEKGNLTPVQWGSYIQGVRSYQGEIMNKSGLQQKYLNFIDTLSTDEEFQNHDWSGMQLIFQEIFALFKNQPMFEYA